VVDTLAGAAGGAGDLGSLSGLVDNVVDGAGHAVDSLLGAATGTGDLGIVPAVVHDVGNIVASIASFDAGNPLGGLNLTGLSQDANIASGLADASSHSNADLSGLLHDAGSADLSDVGALLNGHGIGDILSSNLDLDHLTSNLNLFDTAHVDTGTDIHHS
jgi:hypothetical protein